MDTFDFKPMSDENKEKVEAVKQKAIELAILFDEAMPKEERSEASRLMNIARTNLEQTIMWAVKALSRA